jgi:hypothetical protein
VSQPATVIAFPRRHAHNELLLTYNRLAVELGVSKRFLQARAAEGMPDAGFDYAGRKVFLLSEVTTWLDRRQGERADRCPVARRPLPTPTRRRLQSQEGIRPRPSTKRPIQGRCRWPRGRRTPLAFPGQSGVVQAPGRVPSQVGDLREPEARPKGHRTPATPGVSGVTPTGSQGHPSLPALSERRPPSGSPKRCPSQPQARPPSARTRCRHSIRPACARRPEHNGLVGRPRHGPVYPEYHAARVALLPQRGGQPQTSQLFQGFLRQRAKKPVG